MTPISTFGILATVASIVAAQSQAASDADVQLVRQQLINVVASVAALDQQVTGFTGPSSSAALQNAAAAVADALRSGTSNVQPIQGVISINQAAASLLDQVDALNSNVQQATTDIENQKPAIVSSCLGPLVLEVLQQELVLATAFQNAIASKFAPENQDLARSTAQQSIDALNQAITMYSDQTSLPPSCTTTSSSSAAASSSSVAAVSSSATAVTSSVAAIGSSPGSAESSTAQTSSDAGSSQKSTSRVYPSACKSPKPKPSACSGRRGGRPSASSPPISRHMGTNKPSATLHCTKCRLPSSLPPSPVTTTITRCKGGCPTMTGPAKYSGAAATMANVDALVLLGAAVVLAF